MSASVSGCCECLRTSGVADDAAIVAVCVAPAAQHVSAWANPSVEISLSWAGVCCPCRQQSGGVLAAQQARAGTPAKAKPVQSNQIAVTLWSMVPNYERPVPPKVPKKLILVNISAYNLAWCPSLCTNRRI